MKIKHDKILITQINKAGISSQDIFPFSRLPEIVVCNRLKNHDMWKFYN